MMGLALSWAVTWQEHTKAQAVTAYAPLPYVSAVLTISVCLSIVTTSPRSNIVAGLGGPGLSQKSDRLRVLKIIVLTAFESNT